MATDSAGRESGPDALRSKDYWEKVEPTVNGMLGGYSRISPADISESRSFLSPFFQSRKSPAASASSRVPTIRDSVPRPQARLAIDCGAGIGRITKLLLLSFSDEVHLLEQSQAFLNKSAEYIGREADRVKPICASLQSFEPEDGVVYDLVWLQWVTGYLTDEELIAFLVKMASCLNRKHGLIVVKDNTTSGNDPVVDMDDASVTRPKESLLRIFSSAGLTVRQETRQRKLPRGLFPVYMFALSPHSPPHVTEENGT